MPLTPCERTPSLVVPSLKHMPTIITDTGLRLSGSRTSVMTGDGDDFYDEERIRDHRLFGVSEGFGNWLFYWTTVLRDSFRGELEKCVIFHDSQF